jgi:membrane protein implicated in regulation of membrane protease activity
VLLLGSILLAFFVIPRPWGWPLVAAAVAWDVLQLAVGMRGAQRRRAARVVGRTGRVRGPRTVEIRGELWPVDDDLSVGDEVVVVATDGRSVTVRRA